MKKRQTQYTNGKRDASIVSFWPNRLARETKELLYNGLERIVNAGNSESDYLEIAKMYGSFWPLDTQDPDTGLIRWHLAAHDLFLVFRDYLRKIWITDRESLESGHLDVLLGLDLIFADHPEKQFWSFQRRTLNEAWAKLRKTFPNIGVGTRPKVTPIWGMGIFSYAPINDFQRAVYQLFLESWRAKTCSRCSKHFIADKAAQIYCSTECSGGKKRERALAWWNQTGSERRAAHRQKRKAKRGKR